MVDGEYRNLPEINSAAGYGYSSAMQRTTSLDDLFLGRQTARPPSTAVDDGAIKPKEQYNIMTSLRESPLKQGDQELPPPLSSILVATPEHFGDIMGGTPASPAILSLFTPLERVVLTANGNLQRIIR